MRKIMMLVGFVALTISTSGCAVLHEDNRYASKAVARAWPESPTAEVLAAPVLGPLWVVGLVGDAVIIHPVLSVPRAVLTGWDIVSRPPALPVAEMVVGPLRIIAFPVVVLGAELVYIFVPI